MTTQVVNIKVCKQYDVYCGRGGGFGNMAATTKRSKYSSVPIVATKEEAIEAYVDMIIKIPEYMESIVKRCKDKILACHCVQRPNKNPPVLQCHTQVIAYIADNYPYKCTKEEILKGCVNY